MTDAYEQFQALEIRTPDDVPPATPLEWQVERIGIHDRRGLRGTAADTLAVLALRESVRRELEHTGLYIRDARRMGAPWEQIAAALDITEGEAQDRLRTWADGQQQLHRSDVAKGRAHPIGLTDEQHAETLAALPPADDESLPPQLREALAVMGKRGRVVELTAAPAKAPYVTDAVTGWECSAGASLIVEAMTPGPGALGTMHGVIYVCPDHQADAETLISATDCTPEVRPAPPGHRWDPWPCGQITAFGPQKGPEFLAALLAPTT